jgi:tetratricopeptide (TPR) repeat protein
MLDLYVHYFGQTGRGADAISVTLPSYQALPTAPPMPLIRRAQLLEAHGRALTLAGQFEAAEQVLREALACVEQVYGKDQLGTTSTMAKLVSALSKQQRYRQAAALSERAAGIRRKAYGSGHSKIDTLLANTAVMYLNAGDPAKARTFTAELLTALAQRPDVKPSALAEARVIDARVQLASGDLAAAIAVRDEVAPMRAELMVSGQRHFDLLTAALEQAAMR